MGTNNGQTDTNSVQAKQILDIHLGPEELIISQRYELASIINDIFLGLWFAIGTIFFFSDSTMIWGTWLFLIGSLQMLIRPLIRLGRRIHLQRRGAHHPESTLGY